MQFQTVLGGVFVVATASSLAVERIFLAETIRVIHEMPPARSHREHRVVRQSAGPGSAAAFASHPSPEQSASGHHRQLARKLRCRYSEDGTVHLTFAPALESQFAAPLTIMTSPVKNAPVTVTSNK